MCVCVCVCLRRRHTRYSGSVILVPTHGSNTGQNIVPGLRRSAVSVRDVCHSPQLTLPHRGSPSEMEQSEASVMGKRLSTSTSHLGMRKAQKLSKGPSQPADNEHGKSTKNVVQHSLIMHHLMPQTSSTITT